MAANKSFFPEKAKLANKFAISIRVTSIDRSNESNKKDTNLSAWIRVQTTEIEWNFSRCVKEFEMLHANLMVNEGFRGVNLPKLPPSKRSPASMDEYINQKRSEFTQYLSEICHRSILLGCKDILDFIQAPEKVRRVAKRVLETEMCPVRAGQMKKEGEKWKGYRSRYFVLLPNYLLQYFESADAYQIGIQAKGSIDLTLASKILVYDKTSNPFSMGIKTPTRIWKLQCDTESERDEWVNALRNLLQNPIYSGYILDYNDYLRGRISNNGDNVSNNDAYDEDDDINIHNDNEDEDDISMNNNIGYKQELDIQRETMIKWKEKIEELTQEIVNIEQERNETDKEYKLQIEQLNESIDELKQINIDQTKEINNKDNVLSQTQNDLQIMSKSMEKLETEAVFRRNKQLSINDVLFKVQGDSISKLKFNKQSQKAVVFIDGINHLFYYDASGNNKSEQKHIIVKDISVNNNTIQKSMHNHWFLIIGEKRTALFASGNQQTCDKWITFIKQSVAKKDDENDNIQNNEDCDEKTN